MTAFRREEDRAQHEAALAALNGTVTTLREQLARAETALDREREWQHETVTLLRGLIASPQQPKTAPGGCPRGRSRRPRPRCGGG